MRIIIKVVKHLYELSESYIWIMGFTLGIIVFVSSYWQSPLGIKTSTGYTSLMFSKQTGIIIGISLLISIIGNIVKLGVSAYKYIKGKFYHKEKTLQERLTEVNKPYSMRGKKI